MNEELLKDVKEYRKRYEEVVAAKRAFEMADERFNKDMQDLFKKYGLPKEFSLIECIDILLNKAVSKND